MIKKKSHQHRNGYTINLHLLYTSNNKVCDDQRGGVWLWVHCVPPPQKIYHQPPLALSNGLEPKVQKGVLRSVTQTVTPQVGCPGKPLFVIFSWTSSVHVGKLIHRKQSIYHGLPGRLHRRLC